MRRTLCVLLFLPSLAHAQQPGGSCDYAAHAQTVEAVERLKKVAESKDPRRFAMLASFPLHVRLEGRTQEVDFDVFVKRFQDIVGEDVLKAIRDTDPHHLKCRHGVVVIGDKVLSLQPVVHAKQPEGRDPGLHIVWITSGGGQGLPER